MREGSVGGGGGREKCGGGRQLLSPRSSLSHGSTFNRPPTSDGSRSLWATSDSDNLDARKVDASHVASWAFFLKPVALEITGKVSSFSWNKMKCVAHISYHFSCLNIHNEKLLSELFSAAQNMTGQLVIRKGKEVEPGRCDSKGTEFFWIHF